MSTTEHVYDGESRPYGNTGQLRESLGGNPLIEPLGALPASDRRSIGFLRSPAVDKVFTHLLRRMHAFRADSHSTLLPSDVGLPGAGKGARLPTRNFQQPNDEGHH